MSYIKKQGAEKTEQSAETGTETPTAATGAEQTEQSATATEATGAAEESATATDATGAEEKAATGATGAEKEDATASETGSETGTETGTEEAGEPEELAPTRKYDATVSMYQLSNKTQMDLEVSKSDFEKSRPSQKVPAAWWWV